MVKEYIVDQNYGRYTEEEHARWRFLYNRQADILKTRASKEFLNGLDDLNINPNEIPDFEKLSDRIEKRTGWRIVAVDGLIPDDVFFTLLAEKRFPITWWIRPEDKLDYIQEPDLFHDCYGHIPLLINPFFSDFMQLYGKKGLNALGTGDLQYLARLYWYTTEFGLINTDDGLKIYGSGIVSSKGESIYCLEDDKPYRVKFSLKRIMLTEVIIYKFQDIYFVIDSYEDLVNALNEPLREIYPSLSGLKEYAADEIRDDDKRIEI